MLVKELKRLQDELSNILLIQVVYQPDWLLLERPFWFRPPFMDYAPFTVAVGVEDEFWVVLQWLDMVSGPAFLPMIMAKAHETGKWMHSMQDDHDIRVTAEQAVLVSLVNQAVDGHLFVVMGHGRQKETLAHGVSHGVGLRLNPIGWKVDPLLNRRIVGNFANRKLWKSL